MNQESGSGCSHPLHTSRRWDSGIFFTTVFVVISAALSGDLVEKLPFDPALALFAGVAIAYSVVLVQVWFMKHETGGRLARAS